MKKLHRLAILLAAALFFGLFVTAAVSEEVQASNLSAPANLRVEAGVFTWDVVPNAATYFVWLHTDTWGITHTAQTNSVNLQEIFNISASLDPGQAVRLTVAANIGNVSSPISYINWTMPGTQPTQRLSAPTGLHVDSGNTLRWNPVADATRYVVIMRQGHNDRIYAASSHFVNLHAAFNISAHLQPGENVDFSVVAYASGFLSSPASFLPWIMSGPGGGDPPPIYHDTWRVDVNASWAGVGASGQGHHRPGSTVAIDAGFRPGHDFLGWRVHQPTHLIISNPMGRTTTFIMPHSNVLVEAVWWPTGQELPPDFPWWQWPDGGWWQWPDIPWWQWPDMGWRPPGVHWNVNWQNRNLGGVSFNFEHGNFPPTLAVPQGNSVNFQVRVERHLAPLNANFVGQWLRNGAAHGAAFPITLSREAFADVDLRIASVAPGNTGDYALRVATIVNGLTTNVDISRVSVLSIGEQGAMVPPAAIWPQPPELPPLPNVNPMPTPRPNLHVAPGTLPVTGMSALAATPAHNHDLIMGNLDSGGAVLQILPGTREVMLHGRTLDAMVDSGTTLFVVNDLVWTVMSPDFLAYLRERGGSLIGPNGGTFNIGISETHGGHALVAAQIVLTTTVNGRTQAITDFDTPYTIAIELWGFGIAEANPNHVAVFRGGVRQFGSHLNTETGLLSFNTVNTGSFDVNYAIE